MSVARAAASRAARRASACARYSRTRAASAARLDDILVNFSLMLRSTSVTNPLTRAKPRTNSSASSSCCFSRTYTRLRWR
jgi:hypothetical protein